MGSEADCYAIGRNESEDAALQRSASKEGAIMNRSTAKGAMSVAAIALVVVIGAKFGRGAESKPSHAAVANDTSETAEAKIERAMSAGPPEIARSAKIIDKDAQGHVVVLRQGSNDFTCMPGNPNFVGDPPMCADKVAMQWNMDFAEHKPKPTTTVPGIEYMLAGATQRSDSDPFDKTSPAIKIGPHWMMLWPFDPKTTGLPTTHRDRGAYIMWGGTPWAHLHIMGRPEGKQ